MGLFKLRRRISSKQQKEPSGEYKAMCSFTKTGDKLTIEDIKAFETKYMVKLTELYTKFLLENNGGRPDKNVFMISDEQGEDVLCRFFRIEEGRSGLGRFVDIGEMVLPDKFIPIGIDPNGNMICLGIEGKHYENIFFWDHEQGVDDDDDDDEEPDMSNMYYLAPDIYQFVENLYEYVKAPGSLIHVSPGEPPEGYTWHPVEDGTAMVLVEEDIHAEFMHGGLPVARQ